MLPRDFRLHAKRCLDLANEVRDPPTRDELITMANRWTRLAEEAENAQRIIENQRSPKTMPLRRAKLHSD